MKKGCQFETVENGTCTKPVVYLQFCEEHVRTKCAYLGCDRKATQECSQVSLALGYCLRPLCDAHKKCTYHTAP